MKNIRKIGMGIILAGANGVGHCIGLALGYGLKFKTFINHPSYSKDQIRIRIEEECKIADAEREHLANVAIRCDRRLYDRPRDWMLARLDKLVAAIMETGTYQSGTVMDSKDYDDALSIMEHIDREYYYAHTIYIPYTALARIHQLEDKYLGG